MVVQYTTPRGKNAHAKEWDSTTRFNHANLPKSPGLNNACKTQSCPRPHGPDIREVLWNALAKRSFRFRAGPRIGRNTSNREKVTSIARRRKGILGERLHWNIPEGLIQLWTPQGLSLQCDIWRRAGGDNGGSEPVQTTVMVAQCVSAVCRYDGSGCI